MAGSAFEAVRKGIDSLLSDLRGNPQALETVWLSVITFGRQARVVLPLTDIVQFQMPQLVLGTGTSLGAALDLLDRQMKAEIKPQSAEQKGDWKPIVFLLTDGDPTDRWEKTAGRFLGEICGKSANVIAVACGADVNIANLRRITPTVLQLQDGSESSFQEFFKWVSASVQTTSVKFSGTRAEGVELPSLPKGVEVAADNGTPIADRWVFLLAKCGQKKGLYLARFRKESEERGFFGGGKALYKVVAAHALEDFDLEGGRHALTVSTNQLQGMVPCPHCGNSTMAMCGHCNRMMCIAGSGRYTCPWCNKTENYDFTGGFNVSGGAG